MTRANPLLRPLTGLTVLLAAALAGAQEAEKTSTLRYVRRDKGKPVLESEVSETRRESGLTYVSRTERPNEQLTLTARFDRDGKLAGADVVVQSAQTKRAAQVVAMPGGIQLKRPGGSTDMLTKIPANPVVTSSPDWSDILLLVRRYDRAKGGKQEFPGLWIHPTLPYQALTFPVERTGETTLVVKEQKIPLDRFRIKLRSGDYLVWADRDNKVYKIAPANRPDAAVALDGVGDEVWHLK